MWSSKQKLWKKSGSQLMLIGYMLEFWVGRVDNLLNEGVGLIMVEILLRSLLVK